MPSKSRKQQRFMGMIHAYQKGELKGASPSVKKAAKNIDPDDAEHFARTKHKGLPEKIKKKKKKKTNESVVSFTNSLVLENITNLNIKTKEYGKSVKECFHGCPFFGGGKEMECDHPYWDGKGYANMIITQDNSHGRVPDECPLREGGIKIVKYVYLDK